MKYILPRVHAPSYNDGLTQTESPRFFRMRYILLIAPCFIEKLYLWMLDTFITDKSLNENDYSYFIKVSGILLFHQCFYRKKLYFCLNHIIFHLIGLFLIKFLYIIIYISLFSIDIKKIIIYWHIIHNSPSSYKKRKHNYVSYLSILN